MRNLGLVILILITGCSGSEIALQIQEYPEWNWVNQSVFMHNVRTCRSMDICAAEHLFIR